jgi:hypothetical protein
MSCGTKIKTEPEIKELPKLPELVKCDEEAPIYDQDTEYEFNSIFKLYDLSYSTTYVELRNRTDSLEKNDIRYKLAQTSNKVALKVFPNIKMTNPSQLLAQEYMTIIRATSKMRAQSKNPRHYKDIMVPTEESNFQLFVCVSATVGKEKNLTHFDFFVIDLSHITVAYHDYIKTECDPRDEIMFMKTLYYGMNKLKNKVF